MKPKFKDTGMPPSKAPRALPELNPARIIRSDMLEALNPPSIWSNGDIFNEDVIREIVNNALSEYIDTDVTTVSVPAKSLTSDNLTVTESAAKSFGFILAIVLPVFVLIAGIVV